MTHRQRIETTVVVQDSGREKLFDMIFPEEEVIDDRLEQGTEIVPEENPCHLDVFLRTAFVLEGKAESMFRTHVLDEDTVLLEFGRLKIRVGNPKGDEELDRVDLGEELLRRNLGIEENRVVGEALRFVRKQFLDVREKNSLSMGPKTG